MGQSQPFTVAELFHQCPHPQLIATDMDGTLTRQSQFTADLLTGLAQLQEAGQPVVIVTGRSAGWVQGIAHYLPIAGAMAENGGVYLPPNGDPVILSLIPDLAAHRQKLGAMFADLQRQWPHLVPSHDNPFRLTDWTFAIDGLTQTDLTAMTTQCQAQGWGFTYSTVQCHIFPLGQSKAAGLRQVLDRYFPAVRREQVLTVGDSPNDESLFNPADFPHSIGVANVNHYWAQLQHRPCCVTQQPEVAGFLEVVAELLKGGCRVDA